MLVATVLPRSNNGGHRDVTPTTGAEGKISGKGFLILQLLPAKRLTISSTGRDELDQASALAVDPARRNQKSTGSITEATFSQGQISNL
jgi:hypothetical protein